ncbi:MAG: BrnT family toxin [Gemmatimonadaceae bacterium]
MDDLRFDWDPVKARQNLRKHGVTFDEAQTVFADEDAILIEDPEHSLIEERFYLLGLSARLRLLAVIHCSRADDTIIRLISARKATPSERAQYGARWTP